MVDFRVKAVELLERDRGDSVSQGGRIKPHRYGHHLADRITRYIHDLGERFDPEVNTSVKVLEIRTEHD